MKPFTVFRTYFIVSFICMVFIACGPTRTVDVLIEYEPPACPEPEATLMAGAAKVDITPPPGMPMAGHSSLSCSGKGVRNKLMARAIYLKPVKGRPIALVQVDLLSGSLIVHHKVAELAAKETGIGLDIGGLLLCGTHTHSAPGNYFASNLYNVFASNKGGFDKKYFDFLCERIVLAVKKACNTRRPAKIATGSISIKKITVNRSFPAYLKNNTKNKENMDKFAAVNPWLHLIRVDCLDDDGTYKPIGAFSSFSIHPNTPPKELDRLYNPDVTAYSERRLEAEIKRIYNPSWEPVHAAANHTQGDNNSFYGEGIKESFWDFERVGSFIAAMTLQCFRDLDGKLTDDVDIRYAAKEINLFEENDIDGIEIAKKPRVGCSVLGGAQGRGRNCPLSYIPFFAPGKPRQNSNGKEHGHKRVFLGPFQYLLFSKESFPHHIFLQVIQVHDVVLLAVPWEVTFELGSRISAHAQLKGTNAGLNPDSRCIVVSCSNGLCAYITTAEEYSLQYFEGGFNLYGPNTGRFLKCHLGYMVEALAAGRTHTQLPKKRLFTLKARDFYPLEKKYNGKRHTDWKPDFHNRNGKFRDEPFWSFKWYDVPPYLINLHHPLVSIEVSSDNGKTWNPLIIDGKSVDDSGSNISIHCLKKKSKGCMGFYQTRWYNPPARDGRCFRFVIQPREKQEILYSQSFKMKK